jgi:DNA-binding protein HU-beta
MVVNKQDLINQLVKEKRYTKKAATDLVEDFCAMVLWNMERGNPVALWGFGCFDIIERAARSCPNPQTGETCHIPAHWTPRFYPGSAMKRAVKLFEGDEKRGMT